jgi:multicomponent Na+:H+ antiporter subunit A
LYVLTIILTTIGITGITFFLKVGNFTVSFGNPPRFYDVILIGIILIAAFLVTRSQSRLATIALLGSIGFSIALIFLLYSAPDLAMVQFAIETLSVILFVLIIYRLPKYSQLSTRVTRGFDIIISLASGILMTALMLLISTHGSDSRLATYFIENSETLANGRNIVNVILVDFRALDTLGEITVLAIAAIGVFSLIKFVRTQNGENPS